MTRGLTMTKEAFEQHQARVHGPAERVLVVMPKSKPESGSARSPAYEDWLANQLIAAGLPTPARQFRWLDERQYRADLAYPSARLLIEIDGAAHRIKGRFLDDILKSQAALLNDYWILRIATSQVRNGSAVDIVRRALERGRA